MSERWLPVVGFEGCYEVSSRGRVRSLDRVVARCNGTTKTIHGRMLKGSPTNRGYPAVRLSGGLARSIHVLMLEAFVGPAPQGTECCHRDDNKANNCLENLRWDIRPNNAKEAFRNGRSPKGEARKQSKLRNVDVVKIRALLGRKSSAVIAKLFGVHPSTIKSIKRGTNWAHVP